MKIPRPTKREYMVNPLVFEFMRNSHSKKLGQGESFSCPVCDQKYRIYKRKLNSSMARILCWLVKQYKETGDWVHVSAVAPRFVMRNNEISRLGHWGLLESAPNEDETKRDSGLYKPTEKGIDFVHNRINIPKYVFLLRKNELLKCSDEQTNIKDALGDSFNYQELMEA